MQQFLVPQFIDVEDKVFIFMTVRQFLIVLVGSIIIVLSYILADLALFLFTLIIVGGFSLVLAFVKINGQPFHYFLLNIFQTLKKPSLRIWRKDYNVEELNYLRRREFKIRKKTRKVKHIEKNRIRELSLLVNTGGYYKPDEENFSEDDMFIELDK